MSYRRYHCTMTFEIDIYGLPEVVKDLNDAEIARHLDDFFDEYEDGRRPVAIEAFEGLTQAFGVNAVRAALSGVLHRRYRNQRVGRRLVANAIADKRLDGATSTTRVRRVNVKDVTTDE